MARIRTIKPELWVNEQLADCSTGAVLLFIGALNFADDFGVLPAKPRQLQMQVFPSGRFSNTEVEQQIGELIDAGLVEQYTVEGDHFWWLVNFRKHQVINRPTNSKLPKPPSHEQSKTLSEDSVSTHGGLSEDSVRTHTQLSEDSVSAHGGLIEGKERKGKDIYTSNNGDCLTDENAQNKQLNCPHEQIIELWGVHFPTKPKPRMTIWKDSSGANNLRSRWKQMCTAGEYNTLEDGLNWWGGLLAHLSQSKFLSEEWKNFDLRWLVKKENFAKCLEGNYDN